MKSEKKRLSEKEKLFCCEYMLTQNIREAASRAGYLLRPERAGLKLLMRQEIRDFLEKLWRERKEENKRLAQIGYERLAFGSCTDAVQLLFCGENEREGMAERLEQLDLFQISEIKTVKGGGMEIKFFDRLKALERLELPEKEEKEGENSFYQALEKGAYLLGELPDGKDEKLS